MTQSEQVAMPYQYTISDAMELAQKKVSVEGWVPFRWESVTGGNLIEGEVPDGVYTKGPRKGHPRFGTKKNRQLVLVAHTELQTAAEVYERETGQCWDCKGTGQVWAGWSRADGVKQRDCPRCGATGRHDERFTPT